MSKLNKKKHTGEISGEQNEKKRKVKNISAKNQGTETPKPLGYEPADSTDNYVFRGITPGSKYIFLCLLSTNRVTPLFRYSYKCN